MNYEGHEEMRNEIKKISDEMYEIYRRMSEFESRYKWNRATLVERLAGTAMGRVKDDASTVCQHLNEIEHQFKE